ncbi:MAG TPA: MBL fold metallo-hydrolase [Deltaproteobacteria bacterium]|nr:MBL fold metallo-hydrolase [Deltaproteobacteria bacterium]
MEKLYRVGQDIVVLPAYFPVPGAGLLPINAFVIKAREPVLVDTGMAMDSEEFMKALESVIDPPDLRWVWLTHDDADHTGSLERVFQAAPEARLAAYSLGVLRISTTWQVPMNRVYWLNPGDSISAGDRKLTAMRPPLFDNPTTIGVYDDRSKTFFSADCFGAIIPSPVQSTDDVDQNVLSQGMAGWASLDSPWVHMVKQDEFGQALDRIRQIAPETICSAHLPVAAGKTEQFLKILRAVPSSVPSVAPNQMALEQILAQSKGG